MRKDDANGKTMRDDDWIDSARLNVVVGHFGSGKTEFSINLALALAEKRRPFALADLDIVDPYFRSRECAELFQKQGYPIDFQFPSLPGRRCSLHAAGCSGAV